MTDQWTKVPTGQPICAGHYEIGFCYCTAGVTEGYVVKVGTHATDYVPVTVSAAIGDGIGVALKTGAAGEYVPVLFYGAIKLDTSAAVTIGKFVVNASGGATVVQICPVGSDISATLKVFGGSSYVLGLALQTATSGDEIVVLVGKCM